MAKSIKKKSTQSNPQPEPNAVCDELFVEHEFFDPNDSVQVKYEMLRRVSVDKKSVSHTAQSFGFSRPSFYQVQKQFQSGGLPALVPKKPGPRSAHKLNEEVMEFVAKALEQNGALNAPSLAEMIEEQFEFSVHPRSVERALERQKKKRQ